MGSSMNSADDKVKQKILNRIELKCLEMKELMLSQSLNMEYIELRVSLFRHMLLKKEGFSLKDNMHNIVHTDSIPLTTSKKHKHNKHVDVASSQKNQKLPEPRAESENSKHRDGSKHRQHKDDILRTQKQRHVSSKSRSRSSSSVASGKARQRSVMSRDVQNSRKSRSSSHYSSPDRSAVASKHAKRRRRKKPRRRSAEKSRSPSTQPLHHRSRSPFISSGSRQRSVSSGRCSEHSRCCGSWSSSQSRSPSVRRRRGSPSHLDRRRITRARSVSKDSARRQGNNRSDGHSVGIRSKLQDKTEDASQLRQLH